MAVRRLALLGIFQRASWLKTMLYLCTECGNAISENAETCPHCGLPNAGSLASALATLHSVQDSLFKERSRLAKGRTFSIDASEWRNPRKKPLFFSFNNHACNKGPLPALTYLGLFRTRTKGQFFAFTTPCCDVRLEFNTSYIAVGTSTIGRNFAQYLNGEVPDPGWIE